MKIGTLQNYFLLICSGVKRKGDNEMSGYTGRLTNAELARRGPRLYLLQHRNGDCFVTRGKDATYTDGSQLSVLARSYSLPYLLKIGRTALKLEDRSSC